MPTSKHALGEALGELVEAGARRHGGGDGDDLLVGLGLGDQRLGEHRLCRPARWRPALVCLPVTTSNFTTPWYLSALASAGG